MSLVMPPEQQAMARVEVLTEERCRQVLPIQNEFLATKHCLCCVPLSETAGEFRSRFQTSDRRALAAVALSGSGDGHTPIGYVTMTMPGVKRDFFESLFHTLRPGEAYIETLAVREGFRGQGAGRKLLEWSERTARERGATVLSLGVINGNPARRLYERFGFVEKSSGGACTCCLLLCCFGQPYGWCPPQFGAAVMEKPLT
mmetsp:Transcript_12019/g.30859  ORF Transcript_12019/g.30859 Transcript_12019/m.30859 type:complete len:201 (+) Transcript_12019:207-809(+)